MVGSNPEHVTTESLGTEVAIRIRRNSLLTVPLLAVDLESDAVLDDEVLVVPETRHLALRLDPISHRDESKPHDRLVARSAVWYELLDAAGQAPWSQHSQPPNLRLREQLLLDGRLHRRNRILVIETVHRLPERLQRGGPPGGLHPKSS